MQLYYQNTAVVQYFSETEGCQPDYRRTATGQWESRFGESWEAMEEVTELENAFVQWQQQMGNEDRLQAAVALHSGLPHASLPELPHLLPV